MGVIYIVEFHFSALLVSYWIKINNIGNYLNLNCVSACGMTEIVDRNLIINSDFDTIAKLTKEVINKISI